MKKAKSLIIAFIAVMVMALSAIGLAACGGTDVSGTYTYHLTAEQCTGNVYLTGFLAGAAQSEQTNTLVLNKDGTYSLTKELKNTEASKIKDIDVKFIFTGTYTNDGYTVTLSPATDCEFDFNPGGFSAYIHQCSGKASNGDKVEAYSNWSTDPLAFFKSAFLNAPEPKGEETTVTATAETNPETVVTVNKDGSYTYVETSSDDD